MIKLGIIGAMEEELETLLSKLEGESCTRHSGSDFYQGTLEHLPVVIVQCGIGKVNAAICTQILIDLYGVTHILNTGIAGSLNPQLDIGDLVISRDVMYHDVDCAAFDYPLGKVPGMDTLAFPADETLIHDAWEAAEAENPGHTRIARVASGDQFICEKEKKERIISITGGACTEMEGAAIAHTAYRSGIPFVILRAISDKADDSAEMDYPTFERIAAHRCASVTSRIAKMLSGNEGAAESNVCG